jgi:hypothetical protein
MAANPLPLLAFPADDHVTAATVAWGSEDIAFPAENVQDSDPANVTKSTLASDTLTITTSSIIPVAVALINTNATSATINGVSVPIPALDAGGQRIHAWKDLTLSGLGSNTVWSIVLTRSSGPVWIGRICLVTAIQDVNMKYGLRLGHKRPGDIEIQTRLGSIIRHNAKIRQRTAEGEVDWQPSEAMLRQLDANAEGANTPFLFIPDEATNDAWFVTFKSSEFWVRYEDVDVRMIALSFLEVSNGPPNG